METGNSIAAENLQLIQNSQSKVIQNKALNIQQRQSEVSHKVGFNLKEQESMLSVTPKGHIDIINQLESQSSVKEKEYLSPLNQRLDEMKRNLHNLMFNTGMDQQLINIKEDESEYKLAKERDDEFYQMHASVMQDLQEANGQSVNADMMINQNYNQLQLQPNQPNYYAQQQNSNQNITFLASRSDSHTNIDRNVFIQQDYNQQMAQHQLSTIQSQDKTLQNVINQSNDYVNNTVSPPVQMLTNVTQPDQDTSDGQEAGRTPKIQNNQNTDEGSVEAVHNVQVGKIPSNINIMDGSSLPVSAGNLNEVQQVVTDNSPVAQQQLIDKGASGLTIDNIIKSSDKVIEEDENLERTDTQNLREDDTHENPQGSSSPKDSIFVNQVPDVHVHNYYSIDQLQQMQNEGQQIDASSISEHSNEIQEFQDKAFEEDFKKLVDRLNTNLKMHDRNDLLVSQIEEDIKAVKDQKKLFDLKHKKRTMAQSNQQSPFKSSHISHIQALIGHRDQYAARLREFDQAKSTQSHQFIKEKLNQASKQALSSINTFGPLKADGNNIQITGDQSTNFMSQMQSSAMKNNSLNKIQNTPQSNLNFGPAFGPNNASDGQLDMLNTLNKNQNHGLNRINSPSTDMNDEFQSSQNMKTYPSQNMQYQMAMGDQHITPLSMGLNQLSNAEIETSHDKINNQIKNNQESYKNFKNYLKNIKKTDKNGEPIQLIIQGVNSNQGKQQVQPQSFYVEQLPSGAIQYVAPDGSVFYQQGPDEVNAGGQLYAFGYPQQDQSQFDQNGNSSHFNSMNNQQIEDKGLNKQQLNQDSQGYLSNEQFHQQYQHAQMFQIEDQNMNKDIVHIPNMVQEQQHFMSDMSGDMTRENQHMTSADKLETYSGSDGQTIRIPGQQGFNSGAQQIRTSLNQQQNVNFEFTSQRTLNAGSKEMMDQLSQKQLQAQVIRNQKRTTERGEIEHGSPNPSQVEGDLKRDYIEGQGSNQKLHTEDNEGAMQGRQTVEFDQNKNHNDSAININSMQEASESKLSKNQMLRPSFKNTNSPETGFRDMATSGIGINIQEDPAETLKDNKEMTFKKDQVQGTITAKSASTKQIIGVASRNIAVEVGPGAVEPKIISKQGPKGRWNHKQNFTSLKPKVANQLMILPDMQILSPLHIHKMSPQSSRESTIKHMHDNKQNLMMQLNHKQSNQNMTSYTQSYRPTPLSTNKNHLSNVVNQRLVGDNTLATINTSKASSKIHVFQRDPSKQGGLSNQQNVRQDTTVDRSQTGKDSKDNIANQKLAQSVLQNENRDLIQLDSIMKSDILVPQQITQAKDSLGTKSQRHPSLVADHVTKSNSQDTLKTQMIYNQLHKVDSQGAQSDTKQGIFNYIKVQASHQDIQQVGSNLKQPSLSNVRPIFNTTAEGFQSNSPSRRQDIEQRKRNELEAQNQIAKQIHQKNVNKVLRNSKLHRYKFNASKEQAFLAHQAQLTHRSQIPGNISPSSIQRGGQNVSPGVTHTTKFMSKQNSRDSLKKGSISKLDHSASEFANLKGSVYGISLHDQNSMFQIKQIGIEEKPDNNKKHQLEMKGTILIDHEPDTAMMQGSPLKKKQIVINSQDSDNNTDRGVDDVKGFATVHDHDSDQKVHQNILNFVSSHADIENKGRRYKSNDPRAIYLNAKMVQQDIELNEKRKRILLINQQKKALKARGKSLVAGTNSKKDNFQAVKMNSLLTLEELLTIHTKQVNDQVMPFVIGPKTVTHKQNGRKRHDWPQSSGQSISVHQSQQEQFAKGANSSGFNLQNWDNTGKQSRVDTINKQSHGSSFDNSGQVKSSDKDKIQNNFNIQVEGSSKTNSKNANQTHHGSLKLKMLLDKDSNTRNHGKAQSRVTQPTPFGAINIEPIDPMRETNLDIANGTKTQYLQGKKKTSVSPKQNDKGLNLTLQPFKAILISNPWEQNNNGSSVPSSKNKIDKGPNLSQSKLQMHSNARNTNQVLTKSPTGIFRNSPTKTQFDDKNQNSKNSARKKEKYQVRGSISSGRIQGFGGISNANNTGFNMMMVSPNLHGESNQNIHDIQMNQNQEFNQDFTIEEKLNEESYLSKDNFRPFEDKTMEYKAEGQFSSSARNTTDVFKAAIQTATRLGDTPNLTNSQMPGPQQPMIRIQNNQAEQPLNLVTEASVISQSPEGEQGKTPVTTQIKS